MIIPIDKKLLNDLTEQAKQSPRLRKNYNFHELDEPVQRMLNAIEPESYPQPHKHETPPKVEVFIALRGKFKVMEFDEQGNVTKSVEIAPNSDNVGCEIQPGTWHTVVSLESGSVVYEVKQGPYDPETDKIFAPWAPAEGEDGVEEYLEKLRAY